jgi:hypothetical protein
MYRLLYLSKKVTLTNLWTETFTGFYISDLKQFVPEF